MIRSSKAPKHSLPVRVCFMIDDLNRAGVETQLVKIINQLDRAKIEPYLCILASRTDFAASLLPDDCPVHWMGLQTMRRPSALGHAWRLSRFLRRERFDVLHVDLPGSVLFGIPVGWAARTPYLIRTRRDMGYWMGRIDRITGRIYSHLVDMTITNCETCKQSIVDVERARPDTIAILKNDVNLAHFEHIPTYSAPTEPKPQRVVGMVGNLRPEKSPDIFIEAAARVIAQHPDVVFRIAGEGNLRPQLEGQIKDLEIEGKVELPGHVVGIPDFLGELDVAVLSSNTEALPNVLVEYLAAGRPVVATRVGGAEELITNGETGLIVPPLDAVALRNAIDRLLSHPDQAATLAQAGRTHVQAEYGGPSIAERFEVLVMEMMGHS